MSKLAEQLDARLQQLDATTAAHVERLVREVLALTELRSNEIPPPPAENGTPTLVALAAIAEPMGAMTNEEIDRALYRG